jgi:hypothetical protein
MIMAYGKYGHFDDTFCYVHIRDERKFNMRNIIVIFVLSVFLALLVSPVEAADSWRGKIIDIETKEPLEGAVVVAYWHRVWRTPAGGVAVIYEIKEVLTNKEGKFEIPSYTPINLLPILSYIRGPEFTIFKPGYLSLSGVDFGDFFLQGTNEAPSEHKDIGGRTIRFAPGVLELPRLKTRDERLKNIPSLPVVLDFLEKQKNLIRLINKEEESLGLEKSDPYKAREFILNRSRK